MMQAYQQAQQGQMTKSLQQAQLQQYEDKRKADAQQRLAQQRMANALNPEFRQGMNMGEMTRPELGGLLADTGNFSGMGGLMFPKEREQFSTVQSPYGRGGVGQVGSLTGKISGYQQPPVSLERMGAEAQAKRAPPLNQQQIFDKAFAQARGTEAAKPDRGPFGGTGMEQQASRLLLEHGATLRGGGILTRNQEAEYALARKQAQKPYLRTNPDTGESMLVWPEPLDPNLFPSVKKGAQAAQPTGARVETLRGTGRTKALTTASNTIQEIAQILTEAKREGDTVTGVVGTAKARFGGLGRQAGVDVSPRAAKLSRKLETLQGVMGPIILGEKRLSETERQRLNRIIGSVNIYTDEVDLRNAMIEMLDFLDTLESR